MTAQRTRPVALRCERLVDPIGIGTLAPRLSWRLEADPGVSEHCGFRGCALGLRRRRRLAYADALWGATPLIEGQISLARAGVDGQRLGRIAPLRVAER